MIFVHIYTYINKIIRKVNNYFNVYEIYFDFHLLVSIKGNNGV